MLGSHVSSTKENKTKKQIELQIKASLVYFC